MRHKNKKYILFLINESPEGGIEDIIDSFDTLKRAKEYSKTCTKIDKADISIVNRDTWETIYKYECILKGDIVMNSKRKKRFIYYSFRNRD